MSTVLILYDPYSMSHTYAELDNTAEIAGNALNGTSCMEEKMLKIRKDAENRDPADSRNII